MSHTQLIKDTLNILDLNIHFEENCLTKEKYKGQICLIYKNTLQYTPEEYTHRTTYWKNLVESSSERNHYTT
ncbi:hypothetical protein [Enterococcus durans]|uniref:hypothetical protein n=1 Tax=Enterococcus durans TaxID=53345 RepID=UPI0021AFD6C7|nr:hypothetical protein [Enterococcus durans]